MAVRLDNILKYAASVGASDVHFSSETTPLIRIHGELKPIKMEPVGAKDAFEMIGEILTPEQKENIFEKHGYRLLLSGYGIRTVPREHPEATKRC